MNKANPCGIGQTNFRLKIQTESRLNLYIIGFNTIQFAMTGDFIQLALNVTVFQYNLSMEAKAWKIITNSLGEQKKIILLF